MTHMYQNHNTINIYIKHASSATNTQSPCSDNLTLQQNTCINALGYLITYRENDKCCHMTNYYNMHYQVSSASEVKITFRFIEVLSLDS